MLQVVTSHSARKRFAYSNFEYVFAYVYSYVYSYTYSYLYSLIRLFVSLYLIINSRHSARVRWPFMNYKRRWQRIRFAFDCNWQTREGG